MKRMAHINKRLQELLNIPHIELTKNELLELKEFKKLELLECQKKLDEEIIVNKNDDKKVEVSALPCYKCKYKTHDFYRLKRHYKNAHHQ